uniref:WD repeat domain phosphoinositide-interacting protein 2 n=1 Tax=Panagrellus redivivus TaxID=6233 RepID=A0A7E4USS3_PANRE
MTTPLSIQRISFNRDGTSLTVCHDDGYAIYDLPESFNSASLNVVFEHTGTTRMLIAERLSSILMLVAGDKLRRLQVYNMKRREQLQVHDYTSSVKAVKLNRNRCVVCVDSMIFVYDSRKMENLHTIKDTPKIHDGIVDLSLSEGSCYLAYPGTTAGHVNIFDANLLTAAGTIAAHESELAAIKFNHDGTLLATASAKGTVIRVFSIPSGERLFEFARGFKRTVTIHSLAFSMDSKYLCSSSNTETVHVFSLERGHDDSDPKNAESEEAVDQGWVGYLTPYVTPYLPQQVNDIMLRRGSFATAYLPIGGMKTTCAMPRINNKDYLIVASNDGILFCYEIPTLTGVCNLVKQFKLGAGTDENDALYDSTTIKVSPTATAPPSPVDEEQQ